MDVSDIPTDDRRESAMRIVNKYVLISAAAGMVPIPVVDTLTLAGVHVSLIKEISEHYGVEFSQHTARNILIAIAASLIPGSIGSIFGRKVLQAVPLLMGVAGMSVFSAAVSYGLGTLFVRHYEAGGTLDSFDVENLHRIFSRHLPEAS
jgi:uncharacterized protein (DUF697 family)